MRNRLIHGYDDVDFNILWQVISSDLPEVERVLTCYFSRMNPGDLVES